MDNPIMRYHDLQNAAEREAHRREFSRFNRYAFCNGAAKAAGSPMLDPNPKYETAFIAGRGWYKANEEELKKLLR